MDAERFFAELSPVWRDVFEALGYERERGKIFGRTKIEVVGKLKKGHWARDLCPRIVDVAPLGHMTKLRELNLSQTKVEDIAPLADLSSLRAVVMHCSRVRDIAPLAGKTMLEQLYIWCNPIESIAPLATCTALESLSIEYTNVTDVAPLAALRKLHVLDISGTAVRDLSPLASVPLQALIAYRTSLDEATLASFRTAHPECVVETGDAYPTREVRCGC